MKPAATTGETMTANARSVLAHLSVAWIGVTAIACATIRPPAPPSLPSEPIDPPVLPVSTVAIPITVAVDPESVASDVCTYFTGTVPFEESIIFPPASIWGAFDYEVWQQDNGLDVRLADGALRLNLKTYYMAHGWAESTIPPCFPFRCSAQCGWDDEMPGELTIDVAARVAWNPAWHLSISAEPKARSTPCLLTSREIDKTAEIEEAATRVVNEAAARFNETLIIHSNVRPQANAAWHVLQRNISLGEDWSLRFDPIEAAAGPIATPTPASVSTTLALTGRPALGYRLPESTDPIEDVPALIPAASIDPAIAIFTPVTASLDDVTAQLNRPDVLGGKTFVFGRYKVLVKEAALGASGRQAILKLGLKGGVNWSACRPSGNPLEWLRCGARRVRDAFIHWFTAFEGDAYLIGTPVYERVSRTLTFPDAEYDIETWNKLITFVAWLQRVPLTEQLRAAAKADIGESLDTVESRATAALNRDIGERGEAHLSGTVERVEVLGVYMQADHVLVHVEARGRAELRFDSPPAAVQTAFVGSTCRQ